jgi:hypothetical protein
LKWLNLAKNGHTWSAWHSPYALKDQINIKDFQELQKSHPKNDHHYFSLIQIKQAVVIFYVVCKY